MSGASALLGNASSARQNVALTNRILIVTGDYLDAQFWDTVLGRNKPTVDPKYWVERGKKGNLLGTLQAYASVQNGGAIDQILMFFGSGTRLSPFTQSLRNIKSAFPLP